MKIMTSHRVMASYLLWICSLLQTYGACYYAVQMDFDALSFFKYFDVFVSLVDLFVIRAQEMLHASYNPNGSIDVSEIWSMLKKDSILRITQWNITYQKLIIFNEMRRNKRTVDPNVKASLIGLTSDDIYLNGIAHIECCGTKLLK